MEIVALVVGVIQLLVALLLAVGAQFLGISVFSKLTRGINEIEELKKGNAAVGILMASIVIAIAVIVQSGVAGFSAAVAGVPRPILGHMGDLIVAIVIAIVQLVAGVILAVVSIYIAMWILDKYTRNIDLYAELKRGNIAMAILMAGIIIAVAFIIQVGVEGLTSAIS
jgi:uncharacterized membrane protein YjfL (UPF0719 family)